MAFGALIASGTASGASIAAANAVAITGAVSVGDVILAVMGEQTALTATGVTDNLGNTYTALNAGTDAGSVTGRAFVARVTSPGNLSSVTVAATSSGNDFAVAATCWSGPAQLGQEAAPANITSPVTSPFICPGTGTSMSNPSNLVIGWGSGNVNATWTASSPTTIAIQSTRTNAHVVISYLVVTSAASVSCIMTGSNQSQIVLGTLSLREDVLQAQGIF